MSFVPVVVLSSAPGGCGLPLATVNQSMSALTKGLAFAGSSAPACGPGVDIVQQVAVEAVVVREPGFQAVNVRPDLKTQVSRDTLECLQGAATVAAPIACAFMCCPPPYAAANIGWELIAGTGLNVCKSAVYPPDYRDNPRRMVSCGERMENIMTRGFGFLPRFVFQMAQHAATYFSAEAVSLQEVDGLPVS